METKFKIETKKTAYEKTLFEAVVKSCYEKLIAEKKEGSEVKIIINNEYGTELVNIDDFLYGTESELEVKMHFSYSEFVAEATYESPVESESVKKVETYKIKIADGLCDTFTDVELDTTYEQYPVKILEDIEFTP